MARRIARLSDRTVKTAKSPGKLNDGGNLYLVVDKLKDGASGPPAKRWSFIFQWNGKRKEMGLGSLNAVSLAKARELAAAYRGLLASNKNPIEVRRAEQRKQAAGSTFGDIATRLHAAKLPSWKSDKVKKQWLTSMQQARHEDAKTRYDAWQQSRTLLIQELNQSERRFTALRNDAQQFIAEIRKIDQKRKSERDQISKHERENQLSAYLDTFFIT